MVRVISLIRIQYQQKEREMQFTKKLVLVSNTENQLFVSVATFEGLLPAGDEGLL